MVLGTYKSTREHGGMTKAFRSELVPLNPDDEPASALLERIQGER